MSTNENAAVKKYLEENLAKGFICLSTSPYAALVPIVKKLGGGLRVCVDYRALNDLTIKNRYPIPLIREALKKICNAKYFNKLDVIAAFNCLRVA
jgi:hypothetical protein